MQGLVFAGDSSVRLETFPDPSPGPDEVVIGIRASGMCGSDLPRYRLAATASWAATSHAAWWSSVAPAFLQHLAPIGQRVMIHHYWGCGTCKHCRTGYAQMCARGSRVMGTTADGGHAPFLLAPGYSLVPLDESLSFAEGAAIACGTGTAYSALKRLDVPGRDTLAIFGQGPVGLAATQLATVMGARVIAVDPSAERRGLASGLGADVTIDPTDTPPVEAIRELTHGEGADATLDCTGHPDARANCAKAARPWGRVCFVGERGTATFDMTPDVIHKQLTMYGSWTFSIALMAECAQFAVSRKVPLGHVFTDQFTLDQGDAAYHRFAQQGMGKGVFVFDG